MRRVTVWLASVVSASPSAPADPFVREVGALRFLPATKGTDGPVWFQLSACSGRSRAVSQVAD